MGLKRERKEQIEREIVAEMLASPFTEEEDRLMELHLKALEACRDDERVNRATNRLLSEGANAGAVYAMARSVIVATLRSVVPPSGGS